MKHCTIYVKNVILTTLLLLSFAIDDSNGAIKRFQETVSVGVLKHVENNLITVERQKRFPVDEDFEEIRDRGKRQTELMDMEDPKYNTDNTPEEEDGFWTRVVRVALNLIKRFMTWLNE